jgi:hypothetical protein
MANLHGKRIQMNEQQFDKEFNLENAINRIAVEDKELLERLAND